MTATFPPPASPRWPKVAHRMPALGNGDHLTAAEFMRRYEAAPEVKKAELIQGIVIMASPVRIDQHGEPLHIVNLWLGTYAVVTPGTRAATDSTVRLSPDDVPQPDALLRILPDQGGRSRLDSKGYLEGPPELIVEVAASSASIDTREKLQAYRRGGVREYIVWRTEEAEVDAWHLVDDDYVRMTPDADGVLQSIAFPGLWLNIQALLMEDGAALIATLQQGMATTEHAEFVANLAAAKAVS